METVSFAFAVVGVTESIHKFGKALVNLCREYKNLEAELDEILLTVQGLWVKTEVQVQSLENLWPSLQPSLQVLYYHILEHLGDKLIITDTSLQAVLRQNLDTGHMPQKLKVILLKRHLSKTVSDLEEWQRKFDPSWYLITRLANPEVDRQLEHRLPAEPRSAPASPSTRLARMRNTIQQIAAQEAEPRESMFKDPRPIKENMVPIAGTDAYMSTDGAKRLLLDSANLAAAQVSATPNLLAIARHQVRDLARLLLHIDPEAFNLLKCEGVIELAAGTGAQFYLLFEIPPGLSSPRTLRDHLLALAPNPSLTQRVQLAKQLARSVMFVHAAGFVHKNIRPETVLIFENKATPSHPEPTLPPPTPDHHNPNMRTQSDRLGPSFLIGFERFRRAEGHTDRFGDLAWEKNLYRHPSRQGLQPEDIFEMRHDIYSLGVCLLEIALWRSFVRPDPNTTDNACFLPSADLDIGAELKNKDSRAGAFDIKDKLVAMCKDALPAAVGEQYTGVVLACICCMDHSEDNLFRYENGMQDRDGIIVGVRYIENVLLKLEELFL
ncbi:uncharacterized protein BP01DRAFT_360146 [Aspergillus saccharolyticus JOP 1030-1]|uniref:Protein kinase domain-containing protein n=1 Tax=Aspergillus saccharolyticus JOP 1030-1 TaxID=1450539 RepID=A0A318Z3T7_9EURO|nr:hypothetical protein BP01DRAFT_360146 [Aspergillus saccharolyticus JOP 1030-1]PYH41659.1 hypothetical protein BP01DRAFT_360146 [Aspergillus saccharolyticus JOP 1030-1]